MTGFGKGEALGDKFRLSVELKSVNHRFKDMRFKMGNIFNSQEIQLKKKLEEKFKRGSFDIFVNYKKAQTQELKLIIDEDKVRAFVSKMEATLSKFDVQMSINPTDFLRQDFALEDDDKEEELISMMETAFTMAIDSLLSSRQEEGAKLIDTLKIHRDEYVKNFKVIEGLKDSYQESVRE